jgi:hypothetical protein
MKKSNKKLLSDLNKIAAHFDFRLSKIELVKNTVLAIDRLKKKLIFIDNKNLPYFKTIDLQNVDSSSVKFEYSRMDAGDLNKTSSDDFIKNVQLQISHVDPSKSLNIVFYDKREDNITDLRHLIKKARSWRDSISAELPICV